MDSEKKKELFLATLPKKNYHIGKTCAAIKVGRRTFYDWKSNDEVFAEKYDDLIQEDIDDSEERVRLLRQGIPKFDQTGKFVGWKERPHFGALTYHLNAKAKDRGYGNVIEIDDKRDDPRKMSDEELYAAVMKARQQFMDEGWDTSKDGDEHSDRESQ
jgi:hypothetical protein